MFVKSQTMGTITVTMGILMETKMKIVTVEITAKTSKLMEKVKVKMEII